MNTILQPKENDRVIRILESSINKSDSVNKPHSRQSHRVFHRREPLFSSGDLFEGVYILRSGSAKSFITSKTGEEHITHFFYPGDLLGIDGFDQRFHKQSVRFLETSSVCFVKESELHTLIKNSGEFRDCLLQSMSHTMITDNSMMMCLGTCSSEQKVARFLLDLSSRFSERGLSENEFMLSMTRTDMANYLGMAIETVSRIFTHFQKNKLISVKHRCLTILDREALNHFISMEIGMRSKPKSITKKVMN